MFEGKGYNGVSQEAIQTAGGCPQGSIHELRDGIMTRGILFDATLLPGRATPEGWLEPGEAITWADLEQLEEIQGVRVSEGDVILLYTGRWKRREALGAWPTAEGVAGYQADVAYFLKERGVSFIGHDMFNDVSPHGFPERVGLPIHRLALVSLGVSIFDNLDFERLARAVEATGGSGRVANRRRCGRLPGRRCVLPEGAGRLVRGFIGHDMFNDVSPHGFPERVGLPIHRLALVSLGVSIFDNLDFERLAEEARRLNRYEFLFTAAPLRIVDGMGSPLNPIATF